MLKERVVYLDGRYAPWDEAKVHIMSHSFGRGSAIFEVIGFHETPMGPAVFRLDEYIARFRKSASLLEMEPPLSNGELQEAVLETIRRNRLKKGIIKLMGFYPELSFKILPPRQRFQVAVFVFDLEDDLGERPQMGEGGVTACVSRWRRLDPQTVPIEAKVAANYINGMVARTEARNLGFDYAILLDTEGYLAEGGTESLFLVRQGRLLTPALGNILHSITRKTLLEVAEMMGIETFAGRLEPGVIDLAEEIFFSGTTTKLLPVRRVGDRDLADAPGPITRMIALRMEEITSGRNGQYKEWLFPA
ncbi:MAG: aminotransferase class IV [Smithellaceae bacterium]|nr:aminotransferase class IV [Smithellaceae bacterium]